MVSQNVISIQIQHGPFCSIFLPLNWGVTTKFENHRGKQTPDCHRLWKQRLTLTSHLLRHVVRLVDQHYATYGTLFEHNLLDRAVLFAKLNQSFHISQCWTCGILQFCKNDSRLIWKNFTHLRFGVETPTFIIVFAERRNAYIISVQCTTFTKRTKWECGMRSTDGNKPDLWKAIAPSKHHYGQLLKEPLCWCSYTSPS